MIYMDIEKWKLKLPVDKEQYFKEFSGIQSSFMTINDIYITNIAIAIYIKIETNKDAEIEFFKDPLARLLKVIEGYSRQFGYMLPLYAVIECQGEYEKVIDKWSADQDWHHGVFSLFYCKGDFNEQIKDLIGDSEAAFNIGKMEPLTLSSVKRKLDSEIKSYIGQSRDEYIQFLETVLHAIGKEDMHFDDEISRWLEKEMESAGI